jgi:hypothetical protein
MGLDFDAELNIPSIELEIAKELWGQDFSKALSRLMEEELPYGIQWAIITTNEGKINCSGQASIYYGKGALSERLSQSFPKLIRKGLNAELDSLGKKSGGSVYSDEESFTQEDFQILLRSGLHALLRNFQSLAMEVAGEDFDSPKWRLFIRCRKRLSAEHFEGYKRFSSLTDDLATRLSNHLSKCIKNTVLGRNAFKKICDDFLKECANKPKKFARREFLNWNWLLKTFGDSIPNSVHGYQELLVALLKRCFEPKHVFSDELEELQKSLQICIDLIPRMKSACEHFDLISVESVSALCDAGIIPRRDMSEEQLVKCRDVLRTRQRKYPRESFAKVMEVSFAKILVIAGAKQARISSSSYPREEAAVGSEVQCEFCGEKIEKGKHCECRFD